VMVFRYCKDREKDSAVGSSQARGKENLRSSSKLNGPQIFTTEISLIFK